jgi:predicted chitinase
LKNWSHPFKDKKMPLLQLTQLAKATSGYYPLGRNGLWHGGVHFDSGTAGALEQSSVHCLADGEVVAYRIDEQSPTTAYFINKQRVQKPFSRNFVLVRHCLQAPRIEGSADVPPSLTFYSLYMHLQDWQDYRRDPAISRPAFWPEGQTRWVKSTVKDQQVGYPGIRGLNVRHQAHGGKVFAFLPRGAEVIVSGEGDYRKLENSNGPQDLKSADGSLRGYVSFAYLQPIAGEEYRVNASSLRVRTEANAHSKSIRELPNGTVVKVSGVGEFRKLERVNQYIHFSSLEGAREPVAGRVVVLDKPIAIKAGDLIGHMGEYQDSGAEHPEQKLHLEVFSAENVETFIDSSRAWAQRLPVVGKTWLKFAKGTAVVAHQDRFNAKQPPTLRDACTLSDADILVPKSLLDGLSADKKIVIPATPDRKASNWYRLDGLLHDADDRLLDGWVREDVGINPWVSPWSWEGYDIIYNFDSPRQSLASFMRAAGRFNEFELGRHGALADRSDKGPLKSRLYDIIDRNHDGKMTAEELQAAMSLPAHAQSLSHLVIHYESEWRYTPHKWDALDEVLGHSGSTPHLNWVAEKERIREMSWWDEVAGKVGLPGHGQVYHLHPLSMSSLFLQTPKAQIITVAMLKKARPDLEDDYCQAILPILNEYTGLYEINTPIRVAHFLAQVGHESGFKVREENLRYTGIRMRQIFGCKNNQRGYNSVSDECIVLPRLRPKLWSDPDRYVNNAVNLGSYVYANRNGNGSEESQEGYKYRGRGIIQLTGKNNYREYTRMHNRKNPSDPQDFVANPDLIMNVLKYGVESAFVWWDMNKMNDFIARSYIDAAEENIRRHVTEISVKVNGGSIGLAERVALFSDLRDMIEAEINGYE